MGCGLAVSRLRSVEAFSIFNGRETRDRADPATAYE
jgi:hypothetical protein